MKRIMGVLFVLLLASRDIVWADNGELLMSRVPGQTGSVQLQIISNSQVWRYNTQAGKVVWGGYGWEFNGQSSYGFIFDSPDSPDDGTLGVLPWGDYKFTFSGGVKTLTFYISFKDQDWSYVYDYGPDINFEYDLSLAKGVFRLENGDSLVVADSGTYSIRDAYHQIGEPNTSNFLPPVFLKNVINGGNAGGTLKLNSVPYNSGDTATAANGWDSIGTNNERFKDYQSSGKSFKHNDWLLTASDFTLSRYVSLNANNRQQFAYFDTLKYVTVQTSLADANGETCPLDFRDPWFLTSSGTQPNTYRTVTSPHHPTGAEDEDSGGVFLNQNPTYDGQLPIYSAKVSQSHEGGGLIWSFQNWSSSGATVRYPNNTESVVVFTAQNGTVTANYSVSKPLPPTDLYVSGDPSEQVMLFWTNNPHPHVTQYEIWRSPDKYRPYCYVTTVDGGAHHWTDDDWQITSGYTDSLVHYRMYSIYNYGSTHDTSDASQATAAYAKPGSEAKRVQGAIQFVDIKRNTPKEYSIGNYPNPFNPSTTMFYQLVENSDVKLVIYDVAGRRVETLVDGMRSAGYHAKVWRARDASGRSVASGMYFYRFVAQPIGGHKPFVTSGKLLLMK